jgi:glycosyltransferase involved in cell wall biosynthesis
MRRRVAFAFSEGMSYPPTFHNMKAYYVTREMERRGHRIDWVKVGGREKAWNQDGIRFAVLRDLSEGHLTNILRILSLARYCIARRIQLVYLDEWLFLRKRPLARLAGQMMLRRLGMKLVLDQRDPYVDFEVATGELALGTKKLRQLSRLKYLLLRQTDLIVLPSRAYAHLYESEGVPEKRVLGAFRGVDTELFRPLPAQSDARSKMGLSGKYVIGWFGLMHSYRMIRETIVPLIENLSKEIPNAHILIGGEGPLLSEFQRLQSSDASDSFTLLGTIPYSRLPEYISICDVTICPVNPEYRFTGHSNWLKIAESIAVGTPVVATKTEGTDFDYRDTRGVVWVGSDYESFLKALQDIRRAPGAYRADAMEQARQFDAYSIKRTIPQIVDRVLSLL